MDRESQRDKVGTTLIALGLVLTAAGLLVRPSRNPFSAITRRNAADDGVDRASADSFPASDPPSIPAVGSTQQEG
jgi:hypothetical protein